MIDDRRADAPRAAAPREVPGPGCPPRHRVHVWPWLRRSGSLVLPHWLAITIGRDIWSWRPLGPAELAHELTHVRQWREHGVLYVVRYAASSWAAWRHGGHWYRDNVFEVEARAGAATFARELDGRGPVETRLLAGRRET